MGTGYLASMRCQLICLLTRRTSPAGRENFAGLKYQNHKAHQNTQKTNAAPEIHTPHNSASRHPSVTWEGLQLNMNQHCTLPTTKANSSLVFTNRTKLHSKGTDHSFITLYTLVTSQFWYTQWKKNTSKQEGQQDDESTGYLPCNKSDAVGIVLV